MDKDQKLITFLDSLGPDADVDFAQQLLEAYDWDLQAALETVTAGNAAPRTPEALASVGHSQVPLQAEEARPPMRTGYVDRLIHSEHDEEEQEAIAMAQSAAAAADEASARFDLERALMESQQAFDQQADIQEQAALAQALEASRAACATSPDMGASRESRSYPTRTGVNGLSPTRASASPTGQTSPPPANAASSKSPPTSGPATRFRPQPSPPISSAARGLAAKAPARPALPKAVAPQRPQEPAAKAVKRPSVNLTPVPRVSKESPTKELSMTKASSSGSSTRESRVPAVPQPSVPQPSVKQKPTPGSEQPTSRQQSLPEKVPKLKAEAEKPGEKKSNLASRCLSRFCSSGTDAKANSPPPGGASKEAVTTPAGKGSKAGSQVATQRAAEELKKPKAPTTGSLATPKAESQATCAASPPAADRFEAREEMELRREREEAEMKRKEQEGGERREPDPVVSALQALRRLHLKRDPAALATCLQTLHAYISNLAKNPQESKFHSINCQNGNFRSRVASLEGGTAVLEACGFVAVDEKLCVDPDFLKSKGPKLWDALSKVAVLLEQVKSCM